MYLEANQLRPNKKYFGALTKHRTKLCLKDIHIKGYFLNVLFDRRFAFGERGAPELIYHFVSNNECKDHQKKVHLVLLSYKLGYKLGFPALRKAVTTHVKKYETFSRIFDKANQLLTRHSPFAPFRLNPRSIVGIFSDYGC